MGIDHLGQVIRIDFFLNILLREYVYSIFVSRCHIGLLGNLLQFSSFMRTKVT